MIHNDVSDAPIVGVPDIFTASVVRVRGIKGRKALSLPFELVGFVSLSLLAIVARQVRKVGVFLVVLSLLPSGVVGDEGLLNVLVEFVQVDIGKYGTHNAALCKASNYAKRYAKSIDFRTHPVEFLCIVSDGGFEIFLKYLSGGSAYATTGSSSTTPRSRTGIAPPRLHERHHDLLPQPLEEA
jgi:hypothetical protein